MSEPFRPYEKLGGDHGLWEEVSGPGAEFAIEVLPVHQSGNDSVWAFLLESGLPVLPSDVPTAG